MFIHEHLLHFFLYNINTKLFFLLYFAEKHQNTEVIGVDEGKRKIPYPLEIGALYSDDVSTLKPYSFPFTKIHHIHLKVFCFFLHISLIYTHKKTHDFKNTKENIFNIYVCISVTVSQAWMFNIVHVQQQKPSDITWHSSTKQNHFQFSSFGFILKKRVPDSRRNVA